MLVNIVSSFALMGCNTLSYLLDKEFFFLKEIFLKHFAFIIFVPVCYIYKQSIFFNIYVAHH